MWMCRRYVQIGPSANATTRQAFKKCESENRESHRHHRPQHSDHVSHFWTENFIFIADLRASAAFIVSPHLIH